MHRVLVIFIVLASFIGCKSNDSKIETEEQLLRINICDDPYNLDPKKIRRLNDVNIVGLLFDGLLRKDKEGVLQLSLAKEMIISSDQKKYTFILKDSYWSNHEKVTSYDFAYTWKKILSKDFPSPMSYQFYVIKNAKEIKEGHLSIDELGITTPDEKTLVIELENPTPYFLEVLSLPFFYPTSKHNEELFPNWSNTIDHFISNGPFNLDRWGHNKEMVLKKSDTYWDGENVKLSKIIMKMVDVEVEHSLYELNELDWAGSPLSWLPNEMGKNISILSKPYYGTYFIRINVQRFNGENDFLNKEIRKALAFSINRKDIVEHILNDNQQIVATTLVPEKNISMIEDSNIAVAKNVLEKGKEKIKGNLPAFTLSYYNNEKNHLIAQTLQRQWKELGIELKLQAVEMKAYYEKIKKQDYELAMSSWIADFPDAINFLEVFNKRDNGINNTGWENEEYLSLLSQAKEEADLSKREKTLLAAEKILLDEVPIIPLFRLTMKYLKKNELKNVNLSSLGHIDFKYAYFEKGNNL